MSTKQWLGLEPKLSGNSLSIVHLISLTSPSSRSRQRVKLYPERSVSFPQFSFHNSLCFDSYSPQGYLLLVGGPSVIDSLIQKRNHHDCIVVLGPLSGRNEGSKDVQILIRSIACRGVLVCFVSICGKRNPLIPICLVLSDSVWGTRLTLGGSFLSYPGIPGGTQWIGSSLF